MSERDRGMAIALLAEAFGVKLNVEGGLTAAKIRIYNQALEKVPAPCLEPMVQRAITTRKFFPKVSELLEDAESVRMQLLGSLKYLPCAQCDESGWETVHVDGVSRVQRCGCWRRHQQRVAELGVGHEPLALPAAVED